MPDTDAIAELTVDGQTKGLPPGQGPMRLGEVGARGWNVLAGGRSAPAARGAEARCAAAQRGLDAPLPGCDGRFALAARQDVDEPGAVPTADRARRLGDHRRHGAAGPRRARLRLPRILLANQLIGALEIDWALDALAAGPEFDFYCLVDLPETVTRLADRAAAKTPGRPLKILLEGARPVGGPVCALWTRR